MGPFIANFSKHNSSHVYYPLMIALCLLQHLNMQAQIGGNHIYLAME
jgi:hypothetical protein